MIWYDKIIIDLKGYDLLWLDMIGYDMVWFDWIGFNLIRLNMIWYDIIWYDMIWFDLICSFWYDLIWFDMFWYDLIWFDMIWYDLMIMNMMLDFWLNLHHLWCFLILEKPKPIFARTKAKIMEIKPRILLSCLLSMSITCHTTCFIQHKVIDWF